MVKRNPLPPGLRKTLDKFEKELQAASYVRTLDVLYKDGRIELVSWDDPAEHHYTFKDNEGWYAYERL